MKKYLLATLFTLAIFVLVSCGGSSSQSLDKVQAAAVKNINGQLVGYGVTKETAPVIVGGIAKDGQGDKVTFVWESYTETGKTYDLVIIVVQKQDGSLVFADILLPSGIVTVHP